LAWKAGQVQSVSDGSGGFAGSGFALHDENGRPGITFGYLSETDAREGARQMQAMIAGTKEIMRAP
jgi:hypothetical protein